MSGIPPHLDTDPGTPSGEWAKSTTTAAFARSEPAPTTSTDSPNKGPFDPKLCAAEEDVPGAYPAAADTHPDPQGSVKDSAVHAAEVSYAYAASAASTAASYLPKGVVDTVSSYMPTSHATATMSTARASEHDVQHKTSLPTTESGGAGSHEHIGGVGSLPGPMNEAGVAKLPDENTDQERYLATGAAVGAAGAAVAAGAYAAKETVVGGTGQTAKEPGPGTQQQHTTAVTSSTLPSHEPLGARPGNHSMGAGALPGNQSEPHVARLPEESIHPQYDSGNVDTAAQVSMKPSEELHGNEAATGAVRHVGGVGALVGDQSEVSVAKLPEERQREHYHEVGPRGDPGAGVTGPVGTEGAVIERREEAEHKAGEHHHHKHHPAAEGAAAGGVGAAAVAAAHHDKEKSAAPPQEASTPTGEGKGEGAREVKEGAEETAKETGVTGAGAKSGHRRPSDTSGDRSTRRLGGDSVQEDGKSPDMQMDLLHVNLRPRAHGLGSPGARWGGAIIDEEHARNDLESDEAHEGAGYQTDYHPAQMHPRPETAGQQTSSQAAEGEKSLGATQADASRPAEQQKPPHVQESQTHKKASFMEKMKGEAKVLLGKIEGKQEKVAEGERMKHPEGQTAPAEPQQQTETAPAEPQKQPQPQA
ncbi:hypothetical protein LXA43DRAFT_1067619 [Ganoderma leucocontextum]|nr:hypothetical protein LXA43DRAFT_1067619 [Ganoderma leucocontextum]